MRRMARSKGHLPRANQVSGHHFSCIDIRCFMQSEDKVDNYSAVRLVGGMHDHSNPNQIDVEGITLLAVSHRPAAFRKHDEHEIR